MNWELSSQKLTSSPPPEVFTQRCQHRHTSKLEMTSRWELVDRQAVGYIQLP
jgi:hypothetical protein